MQSGSENPVPDGYRSPALARVLGRIERSEDFRVLDLGVLTGELLTTFAQAGARVHVHDLVSAFAHPLNDKGRDLALLMEAVRVPPGSIDLVCAWELFDLVTPEEAARVLLAIEHWLAPKAWVLAVFNVAEVDQVHRFRPSGEGMVTPVAVASVSPPRVAATNSQVVGLLSGYKILNSALLRGAFREVLAQRSSLPDSVRKGLEI
jgi:hypothetical protein